MEIVKLTENEVEILVGVLARRCYENYEFQFWNGEGVRLFPYGEIPQILEESFFEILPRFAEVEDAICIEEAQMEEICEKIEKILKSVYEVFDKEDFEEAFADYENWD